MVWGWGQPFSFAYVYLVIPAPFVEKTIFSLIECSGHTCWNKLTINESAFLDSEFSSVDLYCLSLWQNHSLFFFFFNFIWGIIYTRYLKYTLWWFEIHTHCRRIHSFSLLTHLSPHIFTFYFYPLSRFQLCSSIIDVSPYFTLDSQTLIL